MTAFSIELQRENDVQLRAAKELIAFPTYLSSNHRNYFFAEFSMPSTILQDNESFRSDLHRFLSPAVASDFNWLLCYRASEDGWEASTFHGNCDGKENTVTIIKKGAYVFGGYSDIPWGKKQLALF